MEKNKAQRMVMFVILDAQQKMYKSQFDGGIPKFIFCVSLCSAENYPSLCLN